MLLFRKYFTCIPILLKQCIVSLRFRQTSSCGPLDRHKTATYHYITNSQQLKLAVSKTIRASGTDPFRPTRDSEMHVII
jgi:hypothetical protein